MNIHEVFIEFKTQEDKSVVLACAKGVCEITCRVSEKNQYWFKPHDDNCYNKFTDWLDDHNIEYENV